MQATAAGWHACTLPARPGSLYQFVLPDGLRVPDPASRYQPEDVHGPSEVIDPGRLRWQRRGLAAAGPGKKRSSTSCTSARSRPRARSARRSSKLDHLAALGVTAIETHAGRRFPRPPELGLRRGAAVTRRTQPMAGRRTSRRWSMPPMPAG